MSSLWDRFQQYYLRDDELVFSIDISRIRFGDDFLQKMELAAQKAFAAMKALEAGGKFTEQGRPRVLSAQPQTAAQIAALTGDDSEAVYHALIHLAANRAGVHTAFGAGPSADTFALS
jgi:hypothetical protein